MDFLCFYGILLIFPLALHSGKYLTAYLISLFLKTSVYKKINAVSQVNTGFFIDDPCLIPLQATDLFLS